MWREDLKFWLIVGTLATLVAIGVYVEKNPQLRAPPATSPPSGDPSLGP